MDNGDVKGGGLPPLPVSQQKVGWASLGVGRVLQGHLLGDRLAGGGQKGKKGVLYGVVSLGEVVPFATHKVITRDLDCGTTTGAGRGLV